MRNVSQQAKEDFTLNALLALVVQVVARLTTAAAAANGELPISSEFTRDSIREALGSLDALLVLATHCSVSAERYCVEYVGVQRMRNKLGSYSATPDALEELRESIAQARQALEAPDTERYGGPEVNGREG